MSALSLVLLVSACSGGGDMNAVVRGTGERVNFAYDGGGGSDILVTTIDQENFRGRSVMDGAGSSTGAGLGLDLGSSGGPRLRSAQVIGQSTTNR